MYHNTSPTNTTPPAMRIAGFQERPFVVLAIVGSTVRDLQSETMSAIDADPFVQVTTTRGQCPARKLRPMAQERFRFLPRAPRNAPIPRRRPAETPESFFPHSPGRC